MSLTDRNKRIFYIKNLNLIWESTKIFNSFFQLTTVDASKTLEELKLFPQETLTLEEKWNKKKIQISNVHDGMGVNRRVRGAFFYNLKERGGRERREEELWYAVIQPAAAANIAAASSLDPSLPTLQGGKVVAK